MITMQNRLKDLATGDESGFTTAELLGNAALGVMALAAIWLALGAVGADVIAMIKSKMLNTN